MEHSDLELLRRARREPDAFREFYDRYADWIYWWFRRRVDEPAATELTAEAFAVAWQHRGRVRDEGPSSGVRWLFGISRNLYRTYAHDARIERRGRERLRLGALPTADDADLEAIDERIDGRALAGPLHAALAGLPASHRHAVELRVIDELSFAEVARRLGCTEGAARVRVMRSLRVLRATLEELRPACP